MRPTISSWQRYAAQVFPILTMLPIMAGGLPADAKPSACGPANAGQVACLDGRLCRCGFEQGGSVAGRADGHRWDCGALRPDCPPAFSAPDPAGLSGRTPPIFVLPVVPLR